MLKSALDELLRPCLEMFSGSENPVVCFDSTLKCVSDPGGAFLPGENLLSFVREPIPNPMHVLTEATVYKNDRFYCARIMPVKNGAGESEAYIAELIPAESARRISEKADSASSLLPVFNAVEFNSAAIWKNAEKLRRHLMDSGDYASLGDVLGIERAMSNISAVCGNAFEYANMMYGSQSQVRVDAGSLCMYLSDRCNAALAKCGRRIEVLVEPDDLTIYADSRRAVVALVNAIQNALLYSPRDTEPVLAVYRTIISGRDFVEFRVTNENIMFTKKDFKEDLDINFSYQRLGYGIPIIRKFAAVSGGKFSMADENGKMIVKITLPAAGDLPGTDLELHSPEICGYSTGIPDLTESMMMEVVSFFGGSEEPRG